MTGDRDTIDVGALMECCLAQQEIIKTYGIIVERLSQSAFMDRGDGKRERDVVYVGRYHCGVSAYKSVTGQFPEASITRKTARTAIHNLGDTIWQLDFATWITIWILYIVEYAYWNPRNKIGYGCGNGSNRYIAMGYTDSMPYHTGTMNSSKTTYDVSTQYRWIEGLWDNVLDWCDGIYFIDANVYAIKNPANFSDNANGTLVCQRMITRNADDSYISAWQKSAVNGFDYFLYPSALKGSSSTTYVGSQCLSINYFSGNAGNVLCVGGYSYKNEGIGLFYLGGDLSTDDTWWGTGCRLMKLP